jgi:hypothetical protein
MSGTHVFYNGVLMRDCVTKSFDQQVVVDDSGNGLTSKFTIAVESLVFGFFNGAASVPQSEDDLLSHPATTVTKNTGSTDTRGTATDRMGIIQRLLKEPRKDFYFATHGGGREDVSESVYQIMLAATGPDKAGTGDAPEYFKDIFGADVNIRYLLGYNVGTNNFRIPRHNVVDTNNGPRPLDARIVELYGGKAFRLSFSIEVHRHLCLEQDPASDTDSIPFNLVVPGDGAKSNPFVLSNTWSSDETCDDQMRRTRSVEGTLRVRDGRYWSHAFRYLCVPGLLRGYRRVSQRFASDPTNLSLKYRIEDRQAEAAPPGPAIDWDMKHIDSSKDEYGRVDRQLQITLTGRPKSDRELLIGTAIRLLDMRFPGARVHAADFSEIRPIPFNVTGMTISQSASSPTVELMCNIHQHLAGIGGFEQAVEASTQPVAFAGYNPHVWPAPLPFDSASPSGIFACYLQRSCSQWHGIPQYQELDLSDTETENTVPGPPDTGADYWNEVGYESYLEDGALPGVPEGGIPLQPNELASDVYRIDHTALPYTFVSIDSRYIHEPGMMTLPLSRSREVEMTQTVGESTRTLTRTQTSVTLPVHAGMMFREITVRATRHGAPPELPEPAPMLIDHNRVVETLIDSQIVFDAPEASQNQQYRIFAVQAKFKYALDRPLTTTERYRLANNITLGTTPDDNSVSGLALFGRGRIEHHATDIPASAGDPVNSLVAAPTVQNTATGPTVGKIVIS